MRVALLGPGHPYRGGIAHHTASLYRALEAAGHEPQLFNFTRQYPSLLFPGTTQLDSSRDALSVPSERLVDTLNPLTWWSTARAIAAARADLTVVQWWHPFFAPTFGSIARLTKRLRPTRVVWLCHNVLPHEASRVDRMLCGFAYGAADAFLVQAQKEAELLTGVARAGSRIAVAHHPVYDTLVSGPVPGRREARRALGLPDQAPVVLFFGLIRPYKGLGVLLEAMPLVTTPQTRLVIAGECYEDPAIYEKVIEERRLSDRVRFDNRYIANEDVATYFAAADVVVLPYLSATQSGIVQVANAFGVPVIVTNVGGIPEVVTHEVNGLLVPPGDAPALAREIDRYFAEGWADRLRAGIQSARQNQSWQGLVETLMTLV